MKNIISTIKKLGLCYDEEFFELLTSKVKSVNKSNLELCGIYENGNDISVVIPKVYDIFTMSIAIHEAGHLYDYYCSSEIVDSEDTALAWEFKYLICSGQYDLLQERYNLLLETRKNKVKKKKQG